MKKFGKLWRLLSIFALAAAPAAQADEVTEWNETLFRVALMTNPPSSPLVTSRVAAIVQGAVFDAVNGVDHRYTPVFPMAATAPAGASERAAAVQAAYASLVLLYPPATYPSIKGVLDAKRAVSLAALSSDSHESPAAVAAGLAWGQTVADAISTWRGTDGFTPAPPPFTGGPGVGQWRPTPPGLLPGAGPQFAYMTPWVIPSPSQFRPAGPPALTSSRYSADFNETKVMGSITSAVRTADQTTASFFWNSTTASSLWNQVALSLLRRGDIGPGRRDGREDSHRSRHQLLANARLLALLNLAIADAAIACWEAKYHFAFWRPVTAIPLAATDGNPATIDDPAWLPLLVTPNHPEYPSGHSTVSAAAATVLARHFGSRTHFTVDSDLLLGVVRSFPGFQAALDEIANARIFAGIHFRSACDDGRVVGASVANYVLAHALQPTDDDDD
jgi:membrane-associated phospholipid phosphatase